MLDKLLFKSKRVTVTYQENVTELQLLLKFQHPGGKGSMSTLGQNLAFHWHKYFKIIASIQHVINKKKILICLGLPKGLFPSSFPTKTLYAFLVSIMLGEEYNACSSAICDFLHSPVISSLSAPNICQSTIFSNTLNYVPLSR